MNTFASFFRPFNEITTSDGRVFPVKETVILNTDEVAFVQVTNNYTVYLIMNNVCPCCKGILKQYAVKKNPPVS